MDREANVVRTDQSDFKLCSIIIVNYNGKKFLKDCFESLLANEYPPDRIEVIMIDNGSKDDSVEYVEQNFPNIKVIRNPENSFCKALNLGIQAAQGDYIGFLNNDTVIDPRWLPELAKILDQYPEAGAVGGKMMFRDGTINSTGVKEIENFYYEDRGFKEKDTGQYDRVEEVDVMCGGATLYRRECLDDVGPVDEDFVIYFEDVDMAQRCHRKGWKIMYTPHARLIHEYKGSSGANRVCYYYCNRNRLLYLAKHFPHMLPRALKTTHAYLDKEYDMVYEFIPGTIKKLVECNDVETVRKALPPFVEELIEVFGAQRVEHLLARMEVALGLRKLRLGIYDHALHFVGGGQKYVATLASILQDRYDITYIANKPVDLKTLNHWYQIDLSRCGLKIIPLQFYEDRNYKEIDAGIVTAADENPFLEIAKESLNYDFFLNANMLAKLPPMSNISILICHFPDVDPGPHFAVHKYKYIVTNCGYTTGWMRKRWGLDTAKILYPPVNMYPNHSNGAMPGPQTSLEKENLILSVSRFEARGSKKQKELVQAFNRLCSRYPEQMRSWRLVLAGGSIEGIPYADEVKEMARANPRISVRVNVGLEELRRLYASAKIFWHACGLEVDENKNPELIEHFGMTTVEAMQNHCAPIVINGGGQREIVEHDTSGYLFNSPDELCDYTIKLISDPELLEEIMQAAYERSKLFDQERFAAEAVQFFEELEKAYTTVENPKIDDVRTRY